VQQHRLGLIVLVMRDRDFRRPDLPGYLRQKGVAGLPGSFFEIQMLRLGQRRDIALPYRDRHAPGCRDLPHKGRILGPHCAAQAVIEGGRCSRTNESTPPDTPITTVSPGSISAWRVIIVLMGLSRSNTGFRISFAR
jgi:hypothetical protein